MNVIWFVPTPVAVVAAAARSSGAIFSATRRTTASDQQFAELAEGTSDLAVTAMDNVMDWNLRAGPGDFIIVAQMETTTPLSVVSRPGIRTIEALAGKTLLVDAPANGFVVALRAMLADRGLAPDSYEIEEVGGVTERMEALLTGRGDATLLGPPFNHKAVAAGMVPLGQVNDDYPAFPGQGLVARRALLQDRHGELHDVLEALEAGRIAALADRAAALEALAAAGFGGPVGADLLATIPTTLVPSDVGIALLIAQRSQLRLPGADVEYRDLVDVEPIGRVLRQTQGARA